MLGPLLLLLILDSLDTGQTIDIRASRRSGDAYVYVQHLSAGRIACFALEKGNVVAMSLPGKWLAETRLAPGRSGNVYYDVQKKAHYYRISPNEIQPVLPKDASSETDMSIF